MIWGPSRCKVTIVKVDWRLAKNHTLLVSAPMHMIFAHDWRMNHEQISSLFAALPIRQISDLTGQYWCTMDVQCTRTGVFPCECSEAEDIIVVLMFVHEQDAWFIWFIPKLDILDILNSVCSQTTGLIQWLCAPMNLWVRSAYECGHEQICNFHTKKFHSKRMKNWNQTCAKIT